jgi:asparagine synthase (glutamine-hydrolysing)
MCGIAGVLNRGDRGRGADPLHLAAQRMAATLRHRGPDGSSAWASPDGRCALGHARLKVIDLESGDQPMGNEDGSVQVVFNGEIYNFQRLRGELEAAGHTFRTRSDTEVIVHGWEEWGEELPTRLDGMFAFAVWDSTRTQLFLARDRAGKKPLFIYQDDDRIAFASEMKALLALPGADDTMDPRAIPLYLAYGYIPTPGTFYRRVRKLPPATFLLLRADGVRRQQNFWSLDWTPNPISQVAARAGLRDLMTRAVEKRLISDVPLGAFLSGGIDSTIVVGLMAEMMEEPVRTFSIGMADDPSYDETHFARMAADRFGTRHTAFTVEAQEVGLLEELLDAYDEPFGDSSALPTYILSRLTGGDVTVALTGDGGDEMFAGYPRFAGMMVAERMPRWMATAGDSLGQRLPFHPNFRNPSRRFSRFFGAAALPPEERMLRWIGFFSDRLESLLKPEVSELMSRTELTESFRRPLEANAGLSPLARTLALNFETYLLDDLLVKADRNSMAHGLELRSPFLDTALMDFAGALPDGLRIRGGTLKYLLRRAFRDLLPDPIVKRGKMGFGIPLPTWFRTHWRGLVEDRVVGDGSALWAWIRPDPVRHLVAEHMAGQADHGHQIWALLTLESWLRRGRYSS